MVVKILIGLAVVSLVAAPVLGGIPVMPEVTLRHEMDCTEDTYWNKCIFDEEYNRRGA